MEVHKEGRRLSNRSSPTMQKWALHTFIASNEGVRVRSSAFWLHRSYIRLAALSGISKQFQQVRYCSETMCMHNLSHKTNLRSPKDHSVEPPEKALRAMLTQLRAKVIYWRNKKSAPPWLLKLCFLILRASNILSSILQGRQSAVSYALRALLTHTSPHCLEQSDSPSSLVPEHLGQTHKLNPLCVYTEHNTNMWLIFMATS